MCQDPKWGEGKFSNAGSIPDVISLIQASPYDMPQTIRTSNFDSFRAHSPIFPSIYTYQGFIYFPVYFLRPRPILSHHGHDGDRNVYIEIYIRRRLHRCNVEYIYVLLTGLWQHSRMAPSGQRRDDPTVQDRHDATFFMCRRTMCVVDQNSVLTIQLRYACASSMDRRHKRVLTFRLGR